MRLNYFKKGLAIVLAVELMISFAGCKGDSSIGNEALQEGSDASGSVSVEALADGQGTWVERDITPEGLCYALVSPVKMEDGSLVFYGKKDSWAGPLIKYSSADEGQTWTEEEMDWESQTGGTIQKLTLHSSGTCFFSSCRYDEKEEPESISYWALRNGELIKVEILENQDTNMMLLFNEEYVFVSGERNNGGSVEAFNETYNIVTGSKECEYQMDSLYPGTIIRTGWAVDESEENNPKIYFGNYGESDVQLFLLDTKGNVEKTNCTVKLDGIEGTTDEEGNYYFIYNGGICRISKNGSLQEQIMDDGGFVLGLSDSICKSMTFLNEKSFLCVVSSLSQLSTTRLIQYIWDPSVSSEVSSSIQIFSLYENSVIRAAIVEFKKTHPDVEVQYEVGMENETDGAEDVIRTLNTQLVSGNGPDILILDGLSYESYAEKGYLADISDAMDLSLLKSNIVNPFINEDGKCYMIPAMFTAPVLFGEVGDVDKIETLEDLKEAILGCAPRPGDDMSSDTYYEYWSASEQYALGIISIEQLVDFIMDSSASALIENGQINHENLTEVMGFIEEVGKYNQMDKYPTDALPNALYKQTDNYDFIVLGDGGCEYSSTMHARYGWGSLMTPAFFGEVKRDEEETLKGTVISQPGLVENAYKPLSMLSVTASSKEQETAKEFLATVMSENIQSVSYAEGNPVLTTSLDERIAKHEGYVAEHGYSGDMNAFYDNLKTPVTITGNLEVLRDNMIKHASLMISNAETLEQAVAGIEGDMRLLLEEQK